MCVLLLLTFSGLYLQCTQACVCVYVCVPSSLPVLSRGPIWLLWGPLLHGASAWFMGAGQLQLPSRFHRFTSHTSPKKRKKHSSSRLPPLSHPTGQLRRDAVFLWLWAVPHPWNVGRDLHLLLSICSTKSLLVLGCAKPALSFPRSLCFFSEITNIPWNEPRPDGTIRCAWVGFFCSAYLRHYNELLYVCVKVELL